MHVSLAEALEVRGGPLQEEEIWAVLNQSAESLQELFRRGKSCFKTFFFFGFWVTEKQVTNSYLENLL